VIELEDFIVGGEQKVKWLPLGLVNQKLAVLIFMFAVAAVPVSAQVGAQSRADQSSAEPQAGATNSSADAQKSTSTDSGQKSANQTPAKPFVFPTKRERFNRYVKSTVGPYSLLGIGVSAGINQWRDNPEEWEQGASGYGKRYASGFGRNLIQQTVIYGLDSAMGLDTRFRKSPRKGFFPRMKDALAENITSRNREGKRVFSVPRVSGVYASGIIANEAWYPERYNYKDGLRSGSRTMLTGFGLNLVREFIINW
jgi:hypothetical protein